MKKLCSLIAILCFCCIDNVARAQNKTQLPELKINDKVPDLVITKIHGPDQRPVRLSDLYKKGGLIIDFWASWCSPCVAELPVLDSLVTRFDKLSVLAVSHDDSLVTVKFLKARPGIAAHTTITNDDKVLSQLFKHRTIPHMVWVDRSGIVKLITGDYFVNDKNVNAFLQGQTQNERIKKDKVNFDWRKPLHLADSAFLYRSVFSRFADSLSGGELTAGTSNNGFTNRVMAINSSIPLLYWLAFTGFMNGTPNYRYIELHSQDSSKYLWPEENKALFNRSKYFSKENTFKEQREKWLYDNLYCYELKTPRQEPIPDFSQMVINDLNRFLNTKGYIKQKTITCKVLKLTKDDRAKQYIKFYKDSVNALRPTFQRKGNQLIIKGRTFAQIVSYIITPANIPNTYIPLVNETGIDDPIDMVLEFPPGQKITAEVMESAFEKNGLIFTDAKRQVPVLVLEDRSDK